MKAMHPTAAGLEANGKRSVRRRTWDREHNNTCFKKCIREDNRELVRRGTWVNRALSSGWKRLKYVYRVKETTISN